MLSITQSPEVLPKLRRDAVRKLAEQGVRIDERRPGDYRSIDVRVGVVRTADGSALVALGNTKVMVGVKVDVGRPFEDTPDEGNLIVNLEMPPLALPTAEPGPPDENSIEVARVVDRTVRHSGFLNLKSLAIVPGKHVWTIWVDILVLNHDGNIIDASSMATAAALSNLRLPRVNVENDGIKVDKSSRVPINVDPSRLPLTITFAKLGNSIMVDPNLEEEVLADGIYTVGIANDQVVAIQKVIGSFTPSEVKVILNNAITHYKRIREIVSNAASAVEFRV